MSDDIKNFIKACTNMDPKFRPEGEELIHVYKIIVKNLILFLASIFKNCCFF